VEIMSTQTDSFNLWYPMPIDLARLGTALHDV
jgi:hypothetical protein